MTNEYKLRAELSNSKIYQSNSNSHEYLRTGKYLKSKTVVFEDNSEIEDLLHKYEDSKGETKMTVKFDEADARNYDVLVSGEDYGKLVFDQEQNTWVLWPNEIDDGVTYFDSLKETKEAITDEINDYLENN